jgi:rare lipoprotein A
MLRIVSFMLTFGLFASVHAEETKIGLATYYTTKSCQREGTSGVRTANNERFDEHALTAALPTRAFGSLWLVTSLETGKSVTVRQNDFGPNKSCIKRGVVIDLTPAAFKALGTKPKQGEVKVRCERIR